MGDKAMGFDEEGQSNTTVSGYHSSGEEGSEDYSTLVRRGSDSDDDDDSMGTMVRRKPADDSEEEEDEDDDFSGTMKRTPNNPKKRSEASTPDFIKHIQTGNQFSALSVEELKKMKRDLLLEKAKKIEEVRNKYKKMMLPVD